MHAFNLGQRGRQIGATVRTPQLRDFARQVLAIKHRISDHHDRRRREQNQREPITLQTVPHQFAGQSFGRSNRVASACR